MWRADTPSNRPSAAAARLIAIDGPASGLSVVVIARCPSAATQSTW